MIIFRSILLKLPAILVMITITILSSRSSFGGAQLFYGADKIFHFIAYAGLAFAVGLWFPRESWLKFPIRNLLICTAIASVFGVFDEFHQSFVPGRSSDVWDWVSDTLGGAAGSAVVLFGSRVLDGRIQLSKIKEQRAKG